MVSSPELSFNIMKVIVITSRWHPQEILGYQLISNKNQYSNIYLLLLCFPGLIAWKEFYVQFLIAKGHDEKLAEKHAEDYETIPLEADGTFSWLL